MRTLGVKYWDDAKSNFWQWYPGIWDDPWNKTWDGNPASDGH
ncbi:MAG TPA: hypothetical protein VHE55_14100 [Fimbriimonadaceae bacterium]|nr:hypothetical protein [Fimbriimonadaceae bacterium]